MTHCYGQATGGPDIMARVLIVDDTEIVRRALELALKKLGHEAESTSSPLIALELAQARPPDLALLDYRMPGMDGVTLFGAMHDALGDRCPKVLFVSATRLEEIEAKTKPPMRAVGYVKKPFHLEELMRMVNAALVV
jgi:CheY-like chemotaxis protein